MLKYASAPPNLKNFHKAAFTCHCLAERQSAGAPADDIATLCLSPASIHMSPLSWAPEQCERRRHEFMRDRNKCIGPSQAT